MTSTPQATCLDCGEPRAGRYCARCGQDNRHSRLRLTTAAADLFSVSFGIEGRVWRTIGGLTVGPGRLVRAYLDGKRTSYVHPLRYAVMTCAIWWGTLNTVLAGQDLSQLDPALRTLIRNGNWLNLVMVPILAVPVWLVFLGSGRSWLENCYAMLFASGHVFLWRSVLAVIGPWFPEAAATINTVDGSAALVFVMWTLFGLYYPLTPWFWLRLVVAGATIVFGSTLLNREAMRLLVG